MPTHSTYAALAILATLAVQFLRYVIKSRGLRQRMPPGPPGLPILGNALQLEKQLWIQFARWKELYGIPLVNLLKYLLTLLC